MLKGIKAKKKNMNPEVSILYVNPLNILSKICPYNYKNLLLYISWPLAKIKLLI